jgi:hypothetical protein
MLKLTEKEKEMLGIGKEEPPKKKRQPPSPDAAMAVLNSLPFTGVEVSLAVKARLLIVSLCREERPYYELMAKLTDAGITSGVAMSAIAAIKDNSDFIKRKEPHGPVFYKLKEGATGGVHET